MPRLGMVLWLAVATAWAEQGVDRLIRHCWPGRAPWTPYPVCMTILMDVLLMGAVLGLWQAFAWAARARLGAREPVIACYLLLLVAWLSICLRLHQMLAWWAVVLLAAGLTRLSAQVIMHQPIAWREFCRRSAALLALSAVGACLAWVAGDRVLTAWRASRLPPAPAGPNVLWIVLDTVRAEDMGLYGYTRNTTPFLTRLGRQGVVFEQASSVAPWTLPSHASMFTGHYPSEMSADWFTPLDGHWPTIAECFRQHGYATAGVVANAGPCHRWFGLDRGFDFWDDAPAENLAEFCKAQSVLRLGVPEDPYYLGDHEVRDAASINSAVLHWLGRPRQRPFFLFVNYMDAHRPYHAPWFMAQRFGADRPGQPLAQFRRNSYDAAIAYLDMQVGVLLDQLSRQGVLDNTLLIITADHGELVGEHGLQGHGNSLYREVLHVPLLLIYPQQVPAGVRISQPVSLRDLPATVLELSAINGTSLPGVSLATCWNAGSNVAALSPLLSQLHYLGELHGADSLQAGKLHYWFDSSSGTQRLYDISADPREVHDLAHERPHDLAEMQSRLRAVTQQLTVDTPQQNH